MDVPLTIVGGDDDDGALVPLPVDGLLEFLLPWCLAGPARPTEAAHRAWLVLFALGNLAWIYICAVVLSTASSPINMHDGAFWVVFAGLMCSGMLGVLVSHKVWQALDGLDSSAETFVGRLLRAEVLPSTAAAVRSGANTKALSTASNVRSALLQFVPFPALICGLAYLLNAKRPLTTDEIVALVIGVPAVVGVANPNSVLPGQLLEVLCMATADQVKLITKTVRASTAATADYDRLIRDIRRAHDTITELSEFAQWLCLKALLGNGVFVAGTLAFVALEPDPPEDTGYRDYHVRYVSVVGSMFYLFNSITSLLAPAKVSTACQELGEAINDLTATQGQGGPDDIKMAGQEELMKIERLFGFVKGLNRGQGMGFTMKRKRITYTLVVDLVTSVAPLCAVGFPLLLKYTKLEGEEETTLDDVMELMNATEATAACNSCCNCG